MRDTNKRGPVLQKTPKFLKLYRSDVNIYETAECNSSDHPGRKTLFLYKREDKKIEFMLLT